MRHSCIKCSKSKESISFKKDIFTKGESNVYFTVDWLSWLCAIAL